MNTKTKPLTLATANAPAPMQPMTPMEMLSKAVETGQGIDVLEKLMSLQERWQATQSRRAFDEAIAAAKAKIPVIAKKRKVKYTTKDAGTISYEHEDLGEIADTVNPILAEQGLSYRYRSVQNANRVSVTCIVTHREGHFEETTLEAENDTSGKKNAIQAIGSTVTYLQRYTLKLALGLAAAKDDDAQASEGPSTVSEAQIKELQALLEAIDATENDAEKFCEWLGVAKLEEIPATKFKQAHKALDTKRLKLMSRSDRRAEEARNVADHQ